MKIKALANFAHASKKNFIEYRTYEVKDEHAAEFIRGGLAEEVKPEPKPEEPKAAESKKAAKE